MKKLILTAALTASSFAFASTWEVDSAHAAANFAVKHMMVSNVNGSLGDVTGKVEVDDKDVTKSKVDVTIDVKGLNTKQTKRDDHLRSPDFFDVEKFPTATFKSTKIEKGEGAKLKVTGDLTLHGVTKSIEIPLKAVWNGDTIQVAGGAPVAFSDYDIEPPTNAIVSVDDNGEFELQLTFVPA